VFRLFSNSFVRDDEGVEGDRRGQRALFGPGLTICRRRKGVGVEIKKTKTFSLFLFFFSSFFLSLG